MLRENKVCPKTMKNPVETDGKPQKSQTLVRGLDVIDAVARGAGSLSEIANATGMTYSTTHRFTSVLMEHGYLRSSRSREFELGPKLIELGFLAHTQTDLVTVAHPYLFDLAQRDGDTVHLGRREGFEVVYLDKIQGNRPVEINSRIGGRRPLATTGIGMALLLQADELELHRVYEANLDRQRKPSTAETFLARIQGYRAGGYALDLGDDSPLIRCVAAPLLDPAGKIVAAISLSSATDYMSEERLQSLIPDVKALAAQISREIGFRG